jgi:cytidylate kinase
MPIITVSGGLASGAREIAQEAARHLHLDYVDQEIMVQAASRLGVSVSAVESRDERASSLGERLAGVLRNLMERSAAAGAADPLGGGALEMVLARTYGEAAELPEQGGGPLDDERYLKTLAAVVREIAARGNVVILGRGSQSILHDVPEALHVYVTAARAWRVSTLVQREGIAPEEAERRIKTSDHHRQAFHRRYFKVDVDNPCQYDLSVQAGRMSIETAVELIALAARDKTPRPG